MAAPLASLNVTTGIVTWIVQDATGFPGVRCLLDAIDAALASAGAAELHDNWQARLEKATDRVRSKIASAEGATNEEKRSKQPGAAGKLMRALQALVAKAVTAKKASATRGASLRPRLDSGRSALAALLARGVPGAIARSAASDPAD